MFEQCCAKYYILNSKFMKYNIRLYKGDSVHVKCERVYKLVLHYFWWRQLNEHLQKENTRADLAQLLVELQGIQVD